MAICVCEETVPVLWLRVMIEGNASQKVPPLKYMGISVLVTNDSLFHHRN